MADDKKKEAQGQLSLEMQINQALQSRMAILKAQEKALSGQVALAVELCKALKCEQLDDIEARLKTSRQAMEDAAREAGSLNTELSEAGEAGVRAAEKTTSAFDRLNDMIDVVEVTSVAFVAGLIRGFGSVYQTTKNLAKGIGGIIGTLGKLGIQILAMPFNMLSNLFSVAQGTSGMGPSPIRLEMEKLRGEFGDLSVATGKVAASSLDQFRGQLGNVGKSGLSVAKIFGRGPEGLAAAMRENAELMKALGPAVDNFSDVLENNAGELTVYRKGLGLTVEQQAKMMNMAKAMGQDPVKAQHELAAGALNMQNQFGISAKKIAQDVATMQGDVANFGTMTREQMLSASVYTRKLGIELKSLTGLVSSFDDFETAANNAAKLSQAFGMNVDAMKMMQEQDPTKRLSMLQQAFKQSGKAVEQMNRSELKLLASQANMDEETVKLAFSQRGLSMSYDQVQKASDKSKKKQMSQEQVMQKLADSIERVFGPGAQTNYTSFFDAFSKGFGAGITKSKEFKELMRAINASLLIVFRAGREVGKMFMAFFPGIKETFSALTKLFSPERYGKLMEKVKSLFMTFFKDLRTDPKAGVEKFIDGFKKTFLDFFKSGGPLGKTVLNGGKTVLTALGEIFKALLPVAIQGLIDFMKLVTGFFKKSGPAFDASIGVMIGDLVNTMIDLIVAMGEKLWPPMKEMLITIFEKVKPWLMSAAPWLIGAALVKVVLSGLVTAAWGSVTSWLSKKLLQIFTGASDTGGLSLFKSINNIFRKGLPRAAQRIGAMMSEILGPSISGALGSIGGMISKLAGPVGIAIAIGTLGVNISKSTEKMGARLEETFGKTAMQQGIAAASVIDAITLGLLPDSLIEDIAEFTAKISSKMWEFFESFLPAEAINLMQAKVNTLFETLRGIGDIILGVFDFDIDKVAGGFERILAALINELIVFTIDLPKLVFKGILLMGEYLFKGLVKVLTWVLTDGLWYLLMGLAGLVVLIAGFGKLLINMIVKTFKFLGKVLFEPQFRQKLLDGAWNTGKDIVIGLVTALSELKIRMRETAIDALNAFINYWSEKIGPEGMRAINDLIDDILHPLFRFYDKFLEGFTSAWSAVTSFFDLSKLRELGTLIFEGIFSVFTFPARMLSLAHEGWDKFSEFFSLSKLVEFAEEFIDGIADKLFGMLPLKYEIIARTAWASFSSFFSVDKLMGLGRAIVDGIGQGLGSLKDKFTGIASDAWNGVTGFFQVRSPSKKGMSLGKNVSSGITKGLGDTSPDMVNVFDVVFEKMVGISQEKVKLVVDSITGILNGMKDLQQSPGVINIKQRIVELTDAFKSIMALAEDIKDPAVYGQKMGLVGETLNIFSQFASSFKDIASIMPPGSSVDAVARMISKISESLFKKNILKDAVDAIKSATSDKEMFSPAGLEKIKSLGSVFKVLGDFTATLSEIKSVGGEQGIATTMQGIADAFSDTRFGNSINRIVLSIGLLSNQLEANPLLVKHVKNIKIFSRNLSASMTALNNVTGPEDGLITKVSAIGASFLKLEEDMQRLGNDPNLKAVVKVGQSLKGNSKLTVKHEAVQINLSVDIKMDASKIGSGLIAWSDKDVPANRSERRFVTSERTNNFTVAAGTTRG